MSTFLDLLDGVAAYYGSGSDEWVRIAQGGVTPATIPILQQVPGVTITRSVSGSILGYEYANPFPTTPSAATIIDSNAGSGSYGLTSYTAQLPATAVTDSQTGITTMQSGAIVSGTGSTLAAVADRAQLAVAGVALGTKLGLTVDRALYAANPQWWDEHFPSMNPQTWETLVPAGAGGNVVRSLLGIGSNSATMYLDERLLAYAYMAMLQAGAWDAEGSADFDGDLSALEPWFYDTMLSDIELPFVMGTVSGATATSGSTVRIREMTSSVPTTATVVAQNPNSYPVANQWGYFVVAASESSDILLNWNLDGNQGTSPVLEFTANGHTFYYAMITSNFLSFSPSTVPDILTPNTVNIWDRVGNWSLSEESSMPKRGTAAAVAYIMLYGTVTPGGGIAGIEENPNASIHINPDNVINPTTGQPVTPQDNIDDVIQALRNAYPNLFTGSAYEDVPQEDGTTQRIVYIPVPYPDKDTDGNPITNQDPNVDPQVSPQIDPETRPDAAQDVTDWVVDPPAPPDTGNGWSPEPIIPTGSASALYSIYNPSDSELSSFGAWLWSSNFVDQLLKLFSDPMQAIIGLHKVFCAPAISGRGNIKVGYLDSGVQTNLVASQYVTVDCGSVTLREYFGNVMDYDPFTKVSIYLPFIGIEPLDVGEVMRSTLTVVYHVDVLTGACLAEVSVTRDGAGGILYSYAGNAAVQYPISSGSYMGIFSSALSIAGGIAGTIATGGALAPLAMGTASGILSARTRVQHSGSFSGNAGAMGARVPYLIITRPQSALAPDFAGYEGIPANHTVTIGGCSGFIRCKVAHLEGVPATLSELTELESVLSEGIII